MIKWEYMMISHSGIAFHYENEKLNKFGEKGWELVSAYDSPRLNKLTLIFKRPIKETED